MIPQPLLHRYTCVYLSFLFLVVGSLWAGGEDEIFAVDVSIGTDSISFTWEEPATVAGTVHRRDLEVLGWSDSIATIAVGDTSFTDTTLEVGQAYEYAFEHSKNTSAALAQYAFVSSGIDVPIVHNRGQLILLVDKTVAVPCADEIEVLRRDLIGDGWEVIRHDVPRDDGDDLDDHQVADVKQIVVDAYQTAPDQVKAVLIFGHVPVPYSGRNIPDGHFFRALPSDGYYGEIDGVWTDTSDFIQNASQTRWTNVAGDGKFDQYAWPSPVDLMVGRIDFEGMPVFNSSEVDLLKRYVAKAHAWRHGHVSVESKAVMQENREWNWGPWNFIRQFGLEATVRDEIDALYADKNLYAYIGNTGNSTSAGGITSSDLAAGNINAVFAFEGGSYSVDWGYEDAFMRALIGSSGTVLATGWSEYPGYYIHQMGMGKPIGFSVKTMQNSTKHDYREQYPAVTNSVYLGMQGDPTIRMHPVAPPTDVSAIASGSNVSLDWAASSDNQVLGYHVYRADDLATPFVQLNSSLLTTTSYTDTTSRSGDVIYMVRAVKLQASTGTYYNASQGAFVSVADDNSASQPPEAYEQYTFAEKNTATPITLSGFDSDGGTLAYLITEHPANGLIASAGQNVVYTAATDYIGSDTFTFVVMDADGQVSAPATVHILVQGDATDSVINARIEAETIDATNSGSAEIAPDSVASHGGKLSAVENGDWVRYEALNFERGATTLDIAVSTANAGGTIEVRLDAADGLKVGELTVTTADSMAWNDYATISVWLDSIVSGSHDVYFVFRGGSGPLLDLDWFQFNADDLTFQETIEAEDYDSEQQTSVGSDGAITYVDFEVEFGHMQWNTVDGLTGGVRPITFHYANGTGIAQTCTLAFRSPNERIERFDFPDTGGWDQWQTMTLNVNLRPGLNEIRLITNGTYEGVPRLRIDRLVVGVDGVPTPGAKSEAEYFNDQNGVGVYDGGTGQKIGSIQDNNWVRFDRYNFGSAAGRVEVSASSQTAGGTIEFRLDAVDGERIATVNVDGTGDWDTFESFDSTLERSPARIHDLFLVFQGGDGPLMDVDWFQFLPADDSELIYTGDHLPEGPPSIEIIDGQFGIIFARNLNEPEINLVPHLSFDLKDPWLSGSAYIEEINLGVSGEFQYFNARSLRPIADEPAQFMRLIDIPSSP